MKASAKPIQSVWEPSSRLFRVTSSKGNTLSNGGFGVVIRDGEETREFLFVEEVVYLHERGLIDVQCDHATTENHLGEGQLNFLSSVTVSSAIYKMLPLCHMSLPSYLVYAHLRAQGYRVFRHTPERRKILDQMEKIKHQKKIEKESGLPPHVKRLKTDSSSEQSFSDLKLLLRRDAAEAQPPVVLGENVKNTLISWDVYHPNSCFARASPGLPDFYVAATFFASSGMQFRHVQQLLDSANDISLRIATVADAGTIVMFGVTDLGVPAIHPQEDNDDS